MRASASAVTMEAKYMEKDELWRSLLLIAVLLAIALVIAQSSRNCEVPGSSWVPCVKLKEIWRSL
jgi:hypothetical protein